MYKLRVRPVAHAITAPGLICLAFLLAPELFAQGTGPRQEGSLRLAFGFGPGAVEGGGSGASGRVALAVPLESGVYTLRLTTMETFPEWRVPVESTTGIGVLYGREVRGEKGFLVGSAGVGFARGVRLGAANEYPAMSCSWILDCLGLAAALSGMPLYEKDSFRTVGIPVEVEAAWTFASWLGASATVFGDVNGQSSSYGGAVSLVIH